MLPNAKAHEGTGYTPRARRFSIQAPIRYRESGNRDWHEGTTANISRTGILFRADRYIQFRCMLEMQIIFPKEMTGTDTPTAIACWGPVVRSEEPALSQAQPSHAVSIHDFRFLRNQKPPGNDG